MPLAEQRYQRILSELSRKRTLRTSELAALLAISEMTIRRDLKVLEERALLHRIHGGATVDIVPKDIYSQRVHDAIHDKDMIAGFVVQALINKLMAAVTPQVIYFDSGTTAMAVAEKLCFYKNIPAITIVMHGTNIAYTLANQTHHRLHMVGGEIYQNTYSTFGDDALNTIKRLKFDLFLLGASGFNQEKFTNTNYVEVSIKKAVMQQSKEIWLMLDSSKWQQSDFAAICGYDDIDRLFLGPHPHPEVDLIKQNHPSLEITHCHYD